jgi:nicotinamidase-related amidase
MRTAYEKGYNVVTLTDCTATLSDDEQHDEFLGTLQGAETVGAGRGYSN